jgi:hypothetical protein
MNQLGVSSYKKRQLSDEAGYGCIELKSLGIRVFVQYYVCSTNIPCVRVLGYVQEGSAAEMSSELETIDKLRPPSNLMPIPELHKAAIRRSIMSDTAARFSIDAPLVHFQQKARHNHQSLER